MRKKQTTYFVVTCPFCKKTVIDSHYIINFSDIKNKIFKCKYCKKTKKYKYKNTPYLNLKLHHVSRDFRTVKEVFKKMTDEIIEEDFTPYDILVDEENEKIKLNNDEWIVGYCSYCGMPIINKDKYYKIKGGIICDKCKNEK